MTTKRNLSSYDGKLALAHMPDRLIPASALTPYVPSFTIYGDRAPGEVVDTFAGSAGALDAGWLNVGTCSWERDGSGNLWAVSGTGKNWVLRDAGSDVTPIRAVVERTPATSSGLVVFGDVTGANNLELSITALAQWQLRARISGTPTTLNTSFHGVIAQGTVIDITRRGTIVRIEFDGVLANGGEVDLADVSGVDYSACLAGSYSGFTNGGSPVSGTTAKWSLWQAGFLDDTYDGCDWYDTTTATLYRDYDATATTFAEEIDLLPAAALLTKLLTVDGAGSGIDADTLDGTSSAGFATAGSGLTKVSQTTAEVSVASSTDETSLWSGSISGAAIGDIYRVVLFGNYRNTSGGASTSTWRMKLGSTTLITSVAASMNSGNQYREWRFEVEFMVGTTTAIQVMSALGFISGSTADQMYLNTNTTFHAPGYGAATEDLSTAKTLDVTHQHSVNNSTTEIIMKGAYLTRLR